MPCEQIFLPGGTIFKTPQERLASYTYWPVHPMFWPYPLALAGFFYTGTEYIVRCFTCDYTASVNSWIPPENPSEAHARCSPDCSFVQGNGFKICAKVNTSLENNHLAVFENNIKGNPVRSHFDFSTKQSKLNDKSLLLKGGRETTYSVFVADNVFCPPGTYASTDNNSPRYPEMIKGMHKTNREINDIGCDGMNEMVSSLSRQTSDPMVVENQVANLEEAKLEQDSKFLFTDTADTTFFFDESAKKNNHALEDNFSNLNFMTTENNLNVNDNSLTYGFTDGSVAQIKYPQFQRVKSRLQTYTSWKYSSKQRPILLAEAGYFYTGKHFTRLDVKRQDGSYLTMYELYAHTNFSL